MAGVTGAEKALGVSDCGRGRKVASAAASHHHANLKQENTYPRAIVPPHIILHSLARPIRAEPSTPHQTLKVHHRIRTPSSTMPIRRATRRLLQPPQFTKLARVLLFHSGTEALDD